MKEYTEKSAALQFVFDACAECMNTCEEFDGIYADCHQCMLEGVKLKLRDIPAADVRPVVRGHWISEEEAEEKGDYSLRDACSVCGHCDWDCTESAGFNYCPNCGADMREGNK